MSIDFSHITEVPGLKASQDQLMKAYHRYHFARIYSSEKDVLEVACGSGMGLGYLAGNAKNVVGGDIDDTNLSFAKKNYQERKNISIYKLDAQQLPFGDESFDVVILFEAIYYLPDAEQFVRESKRVLRKNGKLLIGSVNREWKDFHISPFATKYYSAGELNALIEKYFCDVTIFGAFPVENGLKARLISSIKRAAMKFNLIPGGLNARAHLKRIFMGKLIDLPAELKDNAYPYIEPVKLEISRQVTDFKILYAVGTKE